MLSLPIVPSTPFIFFVFLPPPWIVAAVAAKSLQSCPTLCNPIDGSPPGSPIPGILQASLQEILMGIPSQSGGTVDGVLASTVPSLASTCWLEPSGHPRPLSEGCEQGSYLWLDQKSEISVVS